MRGELFSEEVVTTFLDDLLFGGASHEVLADLEVMVGIGGDNIPD